MRKAEEIKKVMEGTKNSEVRLTQELLLDIRNTLVQIHIGKK